MVTILLWIITFARYILRSYVSEDNAIGTTEKVTILMKKDQEIVVDAVLDTGNFAMTTISKSLYEKIGSPPIKNSMDIVGVNSLSNRKITYIIKDVKFKKDVVIVENLCNGMLDVLVSKSDIKSMLDLGYIYSHFKNERSRRDL